jgi:hypothetical protein
VNAARPAWLLAVAALVGCGAKGRAPEQAPPATAGHAATSGSVAGEPTLCRALRATVTGRVADPAANELSGLVRSPSRAGLLWSHDDSGAGPLLYELRPDGHEVGRPAVTGAQAVDWEDIAAGPGRLLYVGDIGDNGRSRASIEVYRVPEPAPGAPATAPAARLRLRYPDGPHDAETLLVDPLRGDLLVVTKVLGGAVAYRASARLPAGSQTTLRRVGAVPGVSFVTGGDVSADGRVVALRGYDRVWVWTRRGNERLTATLRRAPCASPTSLLPEGQGEAIALDRRGRKFMTVAEGSPAILRRYVPSG